MSVSSDINQTTTRNIVLYLLSFINNISLRMAANEHTVGFIGIIILFPQY